MPIPRNRVLATWLVAGLTALAAVGCGGGAAPTPAAKAPEPAKPAAPAAPAASPASAAQPAAQTSPTAAGAPAKPAAATSPTAAAAAPAKPASAPSTPGKVAELSLGTGGTAGTYYPFGGAMAKIWGETDPNLKVTVQATGGSVENIRLIGRGQMDIALAQNDIADYAVNGTEMFKDQKVEVLGIASMYPELIQMVVGADAGINDVKDLRGKRFSPGPPGSGTEANARQILDVAGLKPSDLAAYQLLAIAEQTAAFKDRKLDGFNITIGAPAPAITDVATLQSIKLLPIAGDFARQVQSKYKFFTNVTIPANTYRGVTAEVPTIAVQAMLVAGSKVDADAVYRMTKILVDKADALGQAHAKGKDFNKAKPADGISIKLHPGAERYYREVGIAIPQ